MFYILLNSYSPFPGLFVFKKGRKTRERNEIKRQRKQDVILYNVVPLFLSPVIMKGYISRIEKVNNLEINMSYLLI